MSSLRIEAGPVPTRRAAGLRVRSRTRWFAVIAAALVAATAIFPLPAWSDATETSARASAPERKKAHPKHRGGKPAAAAAAAAGAAHARPLPAPGAQARIAVALYYDSKGGFLTGEKIDGESPLLARRALRRHDPAKDPKQPDDPSDAAQEARVTPADPTTTCGQANEHRAVPTNAAVAVYYGWTDTLYGPDGKPSSNPRTAPPTPGEDAVHAAPLRVEEITSRQHGRALLCAPPNGQQPCPFPRVCVCKTYCSGNCCV